jgi:hypothetical protein
LFTIFITFIFFIGTGNNNKPQREFQAGQATMIYTTTNTTKSKSNTGYADKTLVLEDEDIQIVLEEAAEEIKDAKTAQLAVGTTAIDTTTTKITNNLRIGIGKRFGATLSNDEMEAVATQVQTQLKNEAQTKLRSKADYITKNAIATIEEKVSDEEDINMDESAIEKGVFNDQQKAVRDIKYGMDAELNAVQKILPSRAIEIEKAILEERLSLKLGKRVKLVIDEDNEISTSGNDDELFNGLNSFNSKTPKTTSLSSSSSSSPVSENTYGYTSSSSSSGISSNWNNGSQSQTSSTQTSSRVSSNSQGSITPKVTPGSFPKSKKFTSTHQSTSTTLNDYTSPMVGTTKATMKNLTTIDVASTPTKPKLYNKKKNKSPKLGGK